MGIRTNCISPWHLAGTSPPRTWMRKMGSFERRVIRPRLTHTATDSRNQQKKEEEDSRVQLVSPDKAFCVTSDWVGILKRCTVMIGISLSAPPGGSLPRYICLWMCLREEGSEEINGGCKRCKSRNLSTSHGLFPSVKTSNITSRKMMCVQS